MNFELRYFTGTGNSLKVLKTCASVFEDSGNSSQISMISKDETTFSECDIIGFCFPVYAFAIPRICKKYLRGIQKFKKQQNVFILVTAGDKYESGFAIKECERILVKKNSKIIYSGVVEMPINWTTSPKPPFPPTIEDAQAIIETGVARTREMAAAILNRVVKHHRFNYPKRYSKIKFYQEYYLFKYLGIQNLWRLFQVYDTCNGCQYCAKICPTNSIKIIDKKPVWKSSCEQCMRCVNFCPKESIYQTSGGDTKGKNKYWEPDFKPGRRSYFTNNSE